MSKILILGEAWGRDEDYLKRHFVGATGRILNRLLEEVELIPPGASREISPTYNNLLYYTRDTIFEDASIHLTNVFHFHPAGNKIASMCGPRWGTLSAITSIGKDRYLRPEFLHHLSRLDAEISEVRPNLIIGLGATAAWAALGTSGIRKFRGTIAESKWGVKFLPTFHPASTLPGRNPENRAIMVMDLIKAKREAEYPEILRPERFVYVPESLDDFEFAYTEMLGAETISIDIETVGNQITCIGFAWSHSHSFVIPIFDWRRPTFSYWGSGEEPLAWRWIRRLCELPSAKVFQNGLYDIRFLWERYGIMPVNCKHDTMLLHHALQPELQKGLGFLGSIYTDEPAWKLMRPKGQGTIKREDA